MYRGVLLLLCASFYSISAIEIQLIAPTTGNAWNTSQDVTVAWRYESLQDSKGQNITQIDVDLVKGTPDNIKDNISFGVPVIVTSAEWRVNENLEPGDDYMIRFTSVEDPKLKFVGPKFCIIGSVSKAQNSASSNADSESPLLAYLYFLLMSIILIF